MCDQGGRGGRRGAALTAVGRARTRQGASQGCGRPHSSVSALAARTASGSAATGHPDKLQMKRVALSSIHCRVHNLLTVVLQQLQRVHCQRQFVHGLGLQEDMQ